MTSCGCAQCAPVLREGWLQVFVYDLATKSPATNVDALWITKDGTGEWTQCVTPDASGAISVWADKKDSTRRLIIRKYPNRAVEDRENVEINQPGMHYVAVDKSLNDALRKPAAAFRTFEAMQAALAAAPKENPQSQGADYSCGACSSTGWITCPSCHGAVKEPVTRECGACQGTGKQEVYSGREKREVVRECSICAGKGSRVWTQNGCNRCGTEGKVKCLTCGGTPADRARRAAEAEEAQREREADLARMRSRGWVGTVATVHRGWKLVSIKLDTTAKVMEGHDILLRGRDGGVVIGKIVRLKGDEAACSIRDDVPAWVDNGCECFRR